MTLARSGQLGQAVEALRQATRLDPQNPKTHNALGAVLSQMGRLEEADAAYRRALELDPDFYAARKNHASNAFLRREVAVARKEFEELMRRQPRDFVPHLFLGMLAVEAEDLPTARERLMEANRLEPGHPRTVLALVRLHLRAGERSEALKLAQPFGGSPRAAPDDRFALGVLLAEFELNSEAAGLFDRLWREQPDSYPIGINLALVQFRAGQLDDAFQTIERLRQKGFSQADVWNLRGGICHRLGKTNLAIESLRQALQREPARAEHYIDLSTILINAGEGAAARDWIDAGIRNSPDKDRLYVQLGLVAKRERDLPAAEGWYRRALETNPRSEAAAIGLAHLLLLTERREKAIRILDAAAQATPDSAILHYMHGSVLLETAEQADSVGIDAAREELEAAFRLNPQFANTHYRLGRLHNLLGDQQKAARFFETAYSLNPENAQAVFELARIAARDGDRQKAAEWGKILRELHAQEAPPPTEVVGESLDQAIPGSGTPQLLRQSAATAAPSP